MLILGAMAPGLALGQAKLESPANGGLTSGIGQIRGWRCDPPDNGLIRIVIDGSIQVDAPYGSGRADTEGVCGDKNNGWGTTFNFNTIGEGEHTLTASADGEEFGSATFSVGRPSDENYLRGAPLTYYILPDFPDQDSATVVRWQESEQNFMIVESPTGVVPEAGTWRENAINFEVCWNVSNDRSRITANGSDCEDGASLRIQGQGETAGGLECVLAIVTSEEIPIRGGLFAYTLIDTVGDDSVSTTYGRFTEEDEANGVAIITSATVNQCTVEFRNEPD
jgi:hypothetical protein